MNCVTRIQIYLLKPLQLLWRLWDVVRGRHADIKLHNLAAGVAARVGNVELDREGLSRIINKRCTTRSDREIVVDEARGRGARPKSKKWIHRMRVGGAIAK